MATYHTPLAIGMVIIGTITLFIPDFYWFYFWVELAIYIPYLFFVMYVDLKSGKKTTKLKAISGYLVLLLFSINFGLPAVKLFHGNHLIQLGIILPWLTIFWLTNTYKNVMVQIVLPEGGRYRKYSIIYYGFIVLVVVLGGGGYYKSAEYFSRIFGEKAMMNYFSLLLLLASYWMLILAQSSTTGFKRFKKQR